MPNYWDRLRKKEQEEMRRKRMFDQSGATSGTFVNGGDISMGRAVSYGTSATQEKFPPFPPFLRFMQKVLDTDPMLNRIPADTYRKMLLEQQNAEYVLARKYLDAVVKKVGTPEPGTREYTAALNEAWAHQVPYLRFLKALQLLIKADSPNDPAIKAHSDYWEYHEFKALSVEKRDELSTVVTFSLENAGLGEYCGIE